MNGESDPLSATRSGPSGVPCLLDVDLWARREPDGSVTIGITDRAQLRAGPVVHWRGPAVGTFHRKGEAVVSLESEKWVGHLPMPLDGTIVATNEALYGDPTTINRDPYGRGWFYRIHPEGPDELEGSDLVRLR